MKQLDALLIAGAIGLVSLCATAQTVPSPYHTRFAVDASIIVGELAVSGFSLYRSMQRTGLSAIELAALRKEAVPGSDRFSAGYYSARAQTASDLLC